MKQLLQHYVSTVINDTVLAGCKSSELWMFTQVYMFLIIFILFKLSSQYTGNVFISSAIYFVNTSWC